MSFSMLPILFGLQLIAGALVSIRAIRLQSISKGFLRGVFAAMLLLIVWSVVTASLAAAGVYTSPAFLSAWPSFWITAVPPVILLTPVLISARIRDNVRALIDVTPMAWFAGFQALRIFAIGGVYKGFTGEFSPYYATMIGIPDLLFGLSALLVVFLCARGRISVSALMVWHAIGALIILPFGVVLLQMGLPGALHVFNETPSIATIFEFPMALAPTLVVPIFIVVNMAVAWRLFERIRGTRDQTARQALQAAE